MAFLRQRGLSARLQARNVSRLASKNPVTVQPADTLRTAVQTMLAGYRRLPVVGQRKLAGVVTSSDILRALLQRRSLESTVSTAMSAPLCLSPRDTVKKALALFASTRRGGFPLTDRGRLTGMLTEKDLLRAAAFSGSAAAGELMVHSPIYARPQYPLAEIAKMMTIGGYRRLPVAHRGVLVGILTPFDLLTHLQLSRSSLQTTRLTARQVMNRRPLAIHPHTPALEAIQLMIERGAGGLPVTEDGLLRGILTERDILELARWEK